MRKQCLKLVKKLKTPKVRELLKKATKLKKQNKIEEVVQVRSELDQYQEDLKRKRQEQLDKRTQTSVEKQSLFLVRPKKDPHRGMCWVDPYPSINQGRLGHSQVWTEKKPKRYYD